MIQLVVRLKQCRGKERLSTMVCFVSVKPFLKYHASQNIRRPSHFSNEKKKRRKNVLAELLYII
jgi:hypothetical protein